MALPAGLVSVVRAVIGLGLIFSLFFFLKSIDYYATSHRTIGHSLILWKYKAHVKTK